jgi:GDPmannose 4,6-dehydratase
MKPAAMSWVKIDPRYFRPIEIDVLQGDASEARSKHRVTFDELVAELVTSDLNTVRFGKL